jgi:hypothetical protein
MLTNQIRLSGSSRGSPHIWGVILGLLCDFAKNHPPYIATPREIPKTLKSIHKKEERLTRQIESTDRAIDTLVYVLYGLSEEEIKIVEDGSSKPK